MIAVMPSGIRKLSVAIIRIAGQEHGFRLRIEPMQESRFGHTHPTFFETPAAETAFARRPTKPSVEEGLKSKSEIVARRI